MKQGEKVHFWQSNYGWPKDDWNVERPSELFASTHPASQTVLALEAAEAEFFVFVTDLTGEWHDITYKYSIYMK